MSSSIDPLNPNNSNAYQAPAYNPAAHVKKKTGLSDLENIEDDTENQENDDPTQWIDDALKANQPPDTSTQSSNPISRQRRFNNGLGKA